MMNKVSDAQELKLALNSLRADEGHGLGGDLEQVNIELKLDEIVRQHVIKLKQQSTIQPQEFDVVSASTFEKALTEAVSLSGIIKIHFIFVILLSLHSFYLFFSLFVFKTFSRN